MPITLYKQKFRLLDNSGLPYRLRREMLTSFAFYYREPDQTGTEQFTVLHDFNIDEVNDCFWVNLPPITLEWYCVLSVEPLRTIQTALQTTTFPYSIGAVETFATPCPLDSLHGFSPYVSPIDNYWYQYDDENQCYVSTGIKAVNTSGSDHPIVDYIQQGVMSAVTSNAVSNLKTQIDNNINTLTTNITTLQNKRVKAKLNGVTYTEDNNGLIDLGEIEVPSGIDDLRMVTAETETLPSGQIVPKGSVVDIEDKLFSLSSPNQYFNQSWTGNQWYYICILNGNCTIDATLQVYSNKFGGVIYVERNGYNYKAVTTSNALKSYVKLWHNGLTAYLVIKAQQYISMNGKFVVSNGSVYAKGTPVTSPNFDEEDVEELDVFMTSYTEQADYITITSNTYETTFADLSVFNYNVDVDGEVDFGFTDEVTMPTTLNFYALHNGTTISVSDSDGDITTSGELNAGDMAILTIADRNNYSWTYTTKREYEVTSNKVTAITETNKNSTFLYPSLKAVTDLFGTYEPTGFVKSVTVNDETYTPDDEGNVDLGTIGGTEDAITSTTIASESYFHSFDYGVDSEVFSLKDKDGNHKDVAVATTNENTGELVGLSLFGHNIPFGGVQSLTTNSIEFAQTGNTHGSAVTFTLKDGNKVKLASYDTLYPTSNSYFFTTPTMSFNYSWYDNTSNKRIYSLKVGWARFNATGSTVDIPIVNTIKLNGTEFSYNSNDNSFDLGTIGGVGVTNLTASTKWTASTNSSRSFVRFTDEDNNQQEYNVGATWVHTKDGKTATELVNQTYSDSASTPTIGLMKAYVAENSGGGEWTNELKYNGSVKINNTGFTTALSGSMDANTIVELWYKGKSVRLSKNNSDDPVLLLSEDSQNLLNVFLNTASQSSFLFNGNTTGSVVYFRVLKGRLQTAYIEDGTVQNLSMYPNTEDSGTKLSPATYSVPATTSMLVAGQRKYEGMTSLNNLNIGRVIEVDLANASSVLYMVNANVGYCKTDRTIILKNTTSSTKYIDIYDVAMNWQESFTVQGNKLTILRLNYEGNPIGGYWYR